MKKLSILLSVTLFAVIGCGKDEAPKASPKSTCAPSVSAPTQKSVPINDVVGLLSGVYRLVAVEGYTSVRQGGTPQVSMQYEATVSPELVDRRPVASSRFGCTDMSRWPDGELTSNVRLPLAFNSQNGHAETDYRLDLAVYGENLSLSKSINQSFVPSYVGNFINLYRNLSSDGTAKLIGTENGFELYFSGSSPVSDGLTFNMDVRAEYEFFPN